MKKLVVILLTLGMVLSMFACAAPATTETPAAEAPAAPAVEEAAPAAEAAAPMYIPVMAKGFQHQFWQAVKTGAEAAAKDLGVEIYFDGPASETEIDAQVNMVKNELVKNPKAIALAALSTEAVTEILEECAEKGIPVIGFDSGVPDDKTGAVKATASTNNENAAAIAATKFGENADLVAKMQAATPENPVVIGCLSQDAVSASVTGRTTGFVNKMKEIAETYQAGKVSVEGHTKWEAKVEGAAIIIRVEVSATTEATSLQTSANSLLATPGIAAIFCSNEGAVVGLLAATADGEDLADGGKYADLVVAGFDAGKAQKNAIRNGWFYGSVTQDPYQIGYKAVSLAVAAANGEAVADVDTGAQWYNAENIDNPDIALLVYD
jgi:ribose transport system substrate-binding protein